MKNYFEGWYFKIVDKEEKNTFAIIPGISFEEKNKGHSFIQFFDGKAVEMKYFEFDKTLFSYSKKEFQVSIDNNNFSSEGLELNIKEDKQEIRGKIKFGELVAWPVKLFAPGAMNWYRFVPFIECFHGVLGFDHTLEGKLTVNGKEIDFTGGRGYIEKDYGRSFPSYYLWSQSNHFEEENISLMVSFAKIPWFGSYFDGFIIGFLLKDKLYKFATYTGAKIIKLKLLDKNIIIHVKDKKHKLEINAEKTRGVHLSSPVEGSMTGRILESIDSKIQVKLIEIKKKKEKILFEGTGRNAGLDIGGKVEEIKEID